MNTEVKEANYRVLRAMFGDSTVPQFDHTASSERRM